MNSNEKGNVITFKELMYAIKYWFRNIIKRVWIIVLAGIVGGTLGVYYAYHTKSKYKSKLTFALEENSGGLGGAVDLAAEFGISLGGSNKNIFQGENIIPILTSRRVVEQVLLSPDTLNGEIQTMASYYIAITSEGKKIDTSSRLSKVSFPVGQSRTSFTYLQDSLLFNIYSAITGKMLNVSRPDKKLNIYEVSVISNNERFTKVLTEKIVEAAVDFYTYLKLKRSMETVSLLQAEVASMKGSTNNAIRNKATIQDLNVNPVFAQQQAMIQEKQLDVSAYGGAYGELFKSLEMARYQMLKETPLLQIIDDVHYPMEKIKPGRLRTGVLVGTLLTVLAVGILTLIIFINKKLQSDS